MPCPSPVANICSFDCGEPNNSEHKEIHLNVAAECSIFHPNDSTNNG